MNRSIPFFAEHPGFGVVGRELFIIGSGALAAMPVTTRTKKSLPRIAGPDRWNEWSGISPHARGCCRLGRESPRAAGHPCPGPAHLAPIRVSPVACWAIWNVGCGPANCRRRKSRDIWSRGSVPPDRSRRRGHGTRMPWLELPVAEAGYGFARPAVVRGLGLSDRAVSREAKSGEFAHATGQSVADR